MTKKRLPEGEKESEENGKSVMWLISKKTDEEDEKEWKVLRKNFTYNRL